MTPLTRPPTAEPPSRRPWREYGIALLALWLARSLLVLSQADVFGYEEFAKAELGRAMFDALGVEHHRLAYHYYEVGGFIVSHVDALFFAFFDPSVLTVKLVAVSVHSLALVAFMQLARAAYGTRAAALAAMLFVLAPAGLQKLSLLVLGIHFESLCFHAWILLLAGRIAIEASTRPRDLLALGLVCGLGTSFDLTTLAASACAGLALLVGNRRSLRGAGWVWLGAGALLGLAPYLWMAAQVGPAILDLHGETLGAGAGRGRLPQRVGAFAGALWADRPWLDRLELAARGAAALGGTALLLRTRGGPLAWSRLILAHVLVFAAATAASGMAVGRIAHFNEFERPAPFWLGLVLLSAGGLALALSDPRPALRRSALACTALLGLLGARAVGLAMGPVPPARWGESLAALADSRACGLGECVLYLYDHVEGTPEERIALLSRLREPTPSRLRAQLGAAAIGREAADLDAALALARRLGGEHWSEYVLGLGEFLHRQASWDLRRLPALFAPYDEATRDVLFEAAARGPHYMVQQALLERDLALGLQEGFPKAWFEGLGWRMGPMHVADARRPYHAMRPFHPGYDDEAARAFIAGQPEPVRAALERGWRKALAELRFSGAPAR